MHHVYLSPGMFGFAELGSYKYFAHVLRALEQRFRDASERLAIHVVDVLPTASLHRRAAKLGALIDQTAGSEGAIHLLGHSTGGLDARLVASPGARLEGPPHAWLPRLRSVTTMNTPHYGSPLASFFATSQGQRVLYALSAFTIAGLTLGAQPLAIASMMIRLVGRGDRAIGIELAPIDRSVDFVLSAVDEARGKDLRAFLHAIRDDQGAVLQISPEAMDLFAAGFADREGVLYQSTASSSPMPTPRTWIGTLGHPWRAVSLALFSGLHGITARAGKRYPCAAPTTDATEATLARAFGARPDLRANDGIVPLRSQLWGTLVWAGLGDHLDVLGHYRDRTGGEAPVELRHRDWLTSGSEFGDAHFTALIDAVARGMLGAN